MAKYGREGHRSRIRQSYFANGVDGMSDVHIMELFLSLVIPRKDVKPIAYSLFNRFDSLESIFGASYEELVEVDGVGDNTAVAIMMYNDLMKRADNSEISSMFEKENRLGFAKSYIFGREKYNVVFVGSQGEVVDNLHLDFYSGSVKESLVKRLVEYACPAVFVIRCGSKNILGDDVSFVSELKGVLLAMGVVFLDYIAVGIDGCVSINDTKHFKLLEN
ncbi:MAG: helix-hairpin-helix domain-containing protein [Clostridia bacterium]|nr:helix-hairpin-helix domain-containing protein [Clostridia bacterium]